MKNDDKPTSDYKVILDDSSDKNRNAFITFLAFQIYLLVIVIGTTDKDLLIPDSQIQLPLVNFSVPLFGFYIIAPLLLLVFHWNLLFNLNLHSKKLFSWLNSSKKQDASRMLRPFLFNALAHIDSRHWQYHVLRFVLLFLLVFSPLAILVFIQWRFSDYHSLGMTGWHFGAVIIDATFISLYWNKVVKETGNRGIRVFAWLRRGVITGILMLSISNEVILLSIVAFDWIPSRRKVQTIVLLGEKRNMDSYMSEDKWDLSIGYLSIPHELSDKLIPRISLREQTLVNKRYRIFCAMLKKERS